MNNRIFILLFFLRFSKLGKSETDATTDAIVHCDDKFGRYYANFGTLSLTSTEFPIMSTRAAGSTAIQELYVPPLMHPCYSLNNDNNFKNQIFDIYSYGEFVKNVCRRQCAHFLEAQRNNCGDRRPPPSWTTSLVAGKERKINCSNWDVPLTEKGMRDGIFFTYTFSAYDLLTGDDYTAPYSVDEKSMQYLDGMFIKGLHLKPVATVSTQTAIIEELEQQLLEFVTKHPEITHIGYGNTISSYADDIRASQKFFPPILKPTNRFWQILGGLESLDSLSLARLQLDGTESSEAKNLMTNLKSIGFFNVSLTEVPKWLENSKLQFIEFTETLIDSTNISVLGTLAELEHFILRESKITKIKAPFLAKSSNLISLTLECNHISSIDEGAFDYLPNLKFLNIAGNRLISLNENLFANLKNLVVFDVKIVEKSSERNFIVKFDETPIVCQIGAKLNRSFILQKVPTLPAPQNILGLDIRGQTNFSLTYPSFKSFKNLELLNIGQLGLTTVKNLSIESLCNLDDLNLVDNPLSEDDPFPEEMYLNVNLNRLRIGTSTELTKTPTILIAFMRTASQIMYSIPSILSRFDFYKYKIGCDYDLVSSATMFGYQVQNSSCQEFIDDSLNDITRMESLKMETECIN